VTAVDRIPLVALQRQHAYLREELRAAFERVLDSSAFILGREVESFEVEFAEYCGVRHCVGVASGTAALTLALKAAGIGEGDEVIVPAHTFVASALGVLHAGATPVFCDVEEATGLIDLESARAAITSRTAALLPVHLYGQPCDMEAVCSLAAGHGLAVFEDAAQAHGALSRGRRAGSFGTAAGFSFYPSKNLGALGDAGAICTNDGSLAEKARMLRDLGQRRKGEHLLAGVNERLDALQAAVLRVKLPHLDGWNESRRRHALIYSELLDGHVQLLGERPEQSCVYHLFPIRTIDRDELRTRLNEAGVETGIHYTPAVHEQPPLANERRAESFPVASAWAAEELSLPIFPELHRSEIERVAEITRRPQSD
jgi:dTDP-3-amino-3,4,6-trideoxy-alpha-D-glucose transaminase